MVFNFADRIDHIYKVMVKLILPEEEGWLCLRRVNLANPQVILLPLLKTLSPQVINSSEIGSIFLKTHLKYYVKFLEMSELQRMGRKELSQSSDKAIRAKISKGKMRDGVVCSAALIGTRPEYFDDHSRHDVGNVGPDHSSKVLFSCGWLISPPKS